MDNDKEADKEDTVSEAGSETPSETPSETKAKSKGIMAKLRPKRSSSKKKVMLLSNC